MKITKFLFIPFFLLNLTALVAQNAAALNKDKEYHVQNFTISPAIGLNPWPTSDLVISNIVQWDIKKRLSLVSYTAYTYNSVFLRDFNYIKTNYNYSLSQKIGVGTTLYSKRASHTFSLLGGIKYNSFKETLEHPEFEKYPHRPVPLARTLDLCTICRQERKSIFSATACICRYTHTRCSA